MKQITLYIFTLIILASCDCYQVVNGKVIDKITQEPLKAVKVYKKNNMSNKTFTDSLGEFELSSVSGGFRFPPMQVVIEKIGYNSKVQKIKVGGFSTVELEKSNDIPQGTFIYELYFAEFGGRMKNAECKIKVDGNYIIVEQTENTNLTGGKEIFRGLILKHRSGNWILTNNENDINAEEIGGCTEIPIIYFDKKLIEWC